jgi:ubiquinone/menaquinone biosynthesis C-methylase UbiE
MFFKKGLPPQQLGLAMVGAKPGQRVLIVGAGGPDLAAEIALVTGLNGQTVLVDRGPGVAAVEAAAGRAGALVELVDAPLAMLPLDSDSFELVVVQARLADRSPDVRAQIVAEAVRVAEPGRRIVLIEGARRAGLFGLMTSKVATLDEATGRALLERAGTVAPRHLADADGLTFFEGRKKTSGMFFGP